MKFGSKSLPEEYKPVWLLLVGGNQITAFYSYGHFHAISMGGKIVEDKDIESWSYEYKDLEADNKTTSLQENKMKSRTMIVKNKYGTMTHYSDGSYDFFGWASEETFLEEAGKQYMKNNKTPDLCDDCDVVNMPKCNRCV
jgi:hypothetical protein